MTAAKRAVPGEDLLRRLRENPELTASAVEELLRFSPLLADVGQIRIEDVDLGGVTIHAGEAVVASLASANRDAAVFADADRLDLARQDNPRVAFGHGIHHCLEAQLARIELQVAMGARRLRPLIIQPVRPVAKDRSEPHGGQSRPSHPDRTSREAAARRLDIGPRE